MFSALLSLLPSQAATPRAAAAGAAGVVLLFFVARGVIRRLRLRSHDAIIARKREAVAARRSSPRPARPSEALLPALHLPASALARAIADGRWTCEEVVRAYCWWAAECDDKLNCITSARFEEALAEARELDRAGPSPTKPLRGVPVTVKECIKVKGLCSTLGSTHRAFSEAQESALLVSLLMDQGAVVIAHTNVPQTMLSFECSNPLYGRTVNPWDATRVPGGSSGGEAALLAAGGSCVGVGTDIGGSLRIPASFSGVCALKPTRARLSVVGCVAAIPGQDGIPGVAGPMARCVDDLAVLMRAWCTPAMYRVDPAVPPMPFRDAVYAESRHKLRVGVFVEDGFASPHPAYARAVAEARAALERAGHTVVPFTVPAWRVLYDGQGRDVSQAEPPVTANFLPKFMSLISADGGETILKNELTGHVEKNLSLLKRGCETPFWAKRAVASVLEALGQPRVASVVTAVAKVDIGRYWQLLSERNRFKLDFLAAMRAANVDALLSPAHTLPALRHGDSIDLAPACSPTMLYNTLDFPAGVVPVTTVTAEDDAAFLAMKPKDALDKAMLRAGRDSKGLPIGVQVAAPPFDEEVILRALRDIERGINFADHHRPPITAPGAKPKTKQN
jgi:fatty acid amide hydrolase